MASPGIRAVLLDLDGVVVLGERVPDPEGVRRLCAEYEVFVLSNNSTRRREEIRALFRGLGVELPLSRIYTSGVACARYLQEQRPGARVFVIGEEALEEELRAAGLRVSRDAEAVVVGLDRRCTYEKLAVALELLDAGALFVATNRDAALPLGGGKRAPGTGALVGALEVASGRKAVAVGKPEPFFLELVMRDHGLRAEETVVVGDRLDADILGAHRVGLRAALVGEPLGEGEVEPEWRAPTVSALLERWQGNSSS